MSSGDGVTVIRSIQTPRTLASQKRTDGVRWEPWRTRCCLRTNQAARIQPVGRAAAPHTWHRRCRPTCAPDDGLAGLLVHDTQRLLECKSMTPCYSGSAQRRIWSAIGLQVLCLSLCGSKIREVIWHRCKSCSQELVSSAFPGLSSVLVQHVCIYLIMCKCNIFNTNQIQIFYKYIYIKAKRTTESLLVFIICSHISTKVGCDDNS